MNQRFSPLYTITPKMALDLLKIELLNAQSDSLPVTPAVLRSLRDSARLQSTHYSTMIEGNRLDTSQIEKVLKHEGHFPGRERDQKEVQGYYAALTFAEEIVRTKQSLTEKTIQHIHALVMSDGAGKKPAATPYRDSQNVIRDGATGAIVYLPPEAADVAGLMAALVDFAAHTRDVPVAIIAGIVHYQFATIHPYYDGNGRTSRLLTGLVLHQRGYGLKGLYSLEEYYARNLPAYYAALTVGPSHNYYMGRAEADITAWLEYFIEGMAQSFEAVIRTMKEAHARGAADRSELLRYLEPRQRKIIALFEKQARVSSRDVSKFLGISTSLATHICHKWAKEGFFIVANPSNKMRTYELAAEYCSR